MDNGSVVPRSRLVPLSNNEYNITDLNPSFHLSVTILAVTPSVAGSEVHLPPIYPFGNGKALYIIVACIRMYINTHVSVCLF